MLLKLSKLTGDVKHHDRDYINTKMIVHVCAAKGVPDATVITFANEPKAYIHKPVEKVVETLKEHDASLMI